MAYGNELILGLMGNDIVDAIGSIYGKAATLQEICEEGVPPTPQTFKWYLDAAHQSCCLHMKWDHLRTKGTYQVYETPLGVREFSTFDFELFYDVDEMGDTLDTAVFGVAVSGRYFPTFVDWKHEHGTLDPIVFDPKSNEWDIARKMLVKAIPLLKKAQWIVKMCHY